MQLKAYVVLPVSDSVWLFSNVDLMCINPQRKLKFVTKEFYFHSNAAIFIVSGRKPSHIPVFIYSVCSMTIHKNVDLVVQVAISSCLHQLLVVIVPTTANFQVVVLETSAMCWMPLRITKREIASLVSMVLHL